MAKRKDPRSSIRYRAERAALRIPRSIARALGKRFVARRGLSPEMDLDIASMLHLSEVASSLALHQLGVKKAREESAYAQRIADPQHTDPVYQTRDYRIGACTLRRYDPLGPAELSGPSPVLLLLHGGGFVINSIETHDALARRIARRAGCKVFSLDYRLAPEHPYPAAIEDAEAAYAYLCEHAEELDIDPARIAIGGDSAGATIATVVCQRHRDRHRQSPLGYPAPRLQWLIYPTTDQCGNYASRQTYGDGYLLTSAMIDWFTAQYVGDTPLETPGLSPLLAEDLTDLPPVYLATAGLDPLRDEGLAYGDALSRAGVVVRHRDFPELIHGYITLFDVSSAAQRAVDDGIGVLRDALANA